MELTEEELKEFRNKIYSAYNEYQKINDMYAFTIFIAWCYEYLESYASTKLNTNAKKDLIKKYFESVLEWKNEYKDIINNLFFVRGKIVHRPYLIDYSLEANSSDVKKRICINPLLFYTDNFELLIEILQLVELDLINQEKSVSKSYEFLK